MTTNTTTHCSFLPQLLLFLLLSETIILFCPPFHSTSGSLTFCQPSLLPPLHFYAVCSVVWDLSRFLGSGLSCRLFIDPKNSIYLYNDSFFPFIPPLPSSFISIYHFPLRSIFCCLYSLPSLATAPCHSSYFGGWPCCHTAMEEKCENKDQRNKRQQTPSARWMCSYFSEAVQKINKEIQMLLDEKVTAARYSYQRLAESEVYGQVMSHQSTVYCIQRVYRVGNWTWASFAAVPWQWIWLRIRMLSSAVEQEC